MTKNDKLFAPADMDLSFHSFMASRLNQAFENPKFGIMLNSTFVELRVRTIPTCVQQIF